MGEENNKKYSVLRFNSRQNSRIVEHHLVKKEIADAAIKTKLFEEVWTGDKHDLERSANDLRFEVHTAAPDGKLINEQVTLGELAEDAGLLLDSSPVQGLEEFSKQEILDRVQEHFYSVLEDSDINARIVDMRIIGSRNNGTASDGSDLDILLEYEGDISEDGLFNMLNDVEDGLSIGGVPVDINPITEGKSGTIEEWMERNRDYVKDKVKLQMESFKEATGIELDVKRGRPYHLGSLDVSDMLVRELPDNLVVDGSLYLTGSNVMELPENLNVKGDIVMADGTYILSQHTPHTPDGWYIDLRASHLPENMARLESAKQELIDALGSGTDHRINLSKGILLQALPSDKGWHIDVIQEFLVMPSDIKPLDRYSPIQQMSLVNEGLEVCRRSGILSNDRITDGYPVIKKNNEMKEKLLDELHEFMQFEILPSGSRVRFPKETEFVLKEADYGFPPRTAMGVEVNDLGMFVFTEEGEMTIVDNMVPGDMRLALSAIKSGIMVDAIGEGNTYRPVEPVNIAADMNIEEQGISSLNVSELFVNNGILKYRGDYTSPDGTVKFFDTYSLSSNDIDKVYRDMIQDLYRREYNNIPEFSLEDYIPLNNGTTTETITKLLSEGAYKLDNMLVGNGRFRGLTIGASSYYYISESDMSIAARERFQTAVDMMDQITTSEKDLMEIRESSIREILGDLKSYEFATPIHVYHDEGIADDYITGINVDQDGDIVLGYKRFGHDGSSASSESRRGEYVLSDLDKVLNALQDIQQKEIVTVCDDERVSVKESGSLESTEYERLHGWTHDDPALIYCNTEIDVFFYDSEKNNVEIVDGEYGIDAYEDRRGFFLVRNGEAADAFRQLEEHDMEERYPFAEGKDSDISSVQQKGEATAVTEGTADLIEDSRSAIQDYRNELKSKMHPYRLVIDFTDASIPSRKEIISAEDATEARFDAQWTFEELCKEDKYVKSAVLFDMEQQRSIQKFERPGLPELLKMNAVEIQLEYELDKRAFYKKVSELHDSGYTLAWDELGIPVPFHEISKEASSRSVVPSLSPMIQQYVDFKEKRRGIIPLFHVSGGYETYQDDAERVAIVLGLPVQESATHLGPDGHPARYVSFPEKGSVSWQETPLAKILAKGFPIAILEDMNKGKENNDTRNDERSNNEDRDLGRDEQRDQSRGFHR